MFNFYQQSISDFLSSVQAQYSITIIAKNKDAKLDIEAIADMMTKDQYAILSATKDLKFDDQPEEYLPWLGVKGVRKQALLAKGIDTESEGRTGQMFGAGFYLAASASKAAQYASDNFSKSGFGVVFKMDVALGKNAVWKYGRPEKDELEYADQESQKKVQEYHKSNKLKKRPYEVPVWHTTHDSIHAKKGLALQHDEFVVKSGQQVNITEIILVHKEEK